MTFLVFDVGTSGTKAALVDEQGAVLRETYRAYPTHVAAGGWVEQDADDWWRAACEAACELHARDAGAIALTGQMQNLILMDAAGQPLRRTILYSDIRAHAEAAAFEKTLGRDRLRALTGNDQEAGSLAAKLRWLEQHENPVLASARHLLLGAADYLAFRMTGRAVCDTTNASSTGLLDLNNRAWLDLETVYGLHDVNRLLPTLLAGGAEVGRLSETGAAALGMRAGVPVHSGPGDAGATTLGAGCGAPGKLYAYVGTSGWVAYSSLTRGAPERGVITLTHPHPDLFICIAPLLTAGGNLAWLRDVFGRAEVADMVARALTRPLNRLLYLPYLNGERSPFSDPFARAAFIGLAPEHTPDDLARAVLEGVVFAYKHALDALQPGSVTTMTLTGGGTGSDGFCQLFADVTGVAVGVLAEAATTPAKGAALAARVVRGEAVDYVLEPTIKKTWQPAATALYKEKYEVFREAYPALKPLFARLADMKLE